MSVPFDSVFVFNGNPEHNGFATIIEAYTMNLNASNFISYRVSCDSFIFVLKIQYAISALRASPLSLTS